jgi:hypothetical protein
MLPSVSRARKHNSTPFLAPNESEVDVIVKALISIGDPLIVVVGGGIIVMYLPILQIFDLIDSRELEGSGMAWSFVV